MPGGGGVPPYMGCIGMCRRFQAVYSGIGYKSESLGLEYRVSFSI